MYSSSLLTYTIRIKKNETRYFSGIVFKIDYSLEEENELQLFYGGDRSLMDWKNVIKEATWLFFEIFKIEYAGKLRVYFDDVIWMPVDTDEDLMKYTIIRALADVFKMDFLTIVSKNTQNKFSFMNKLTFIEKEKNFYSL